MAECPWGHPRWHGTDGAALGRWCEMQPHCRAHLESVGFSPLCPSLKKKKILVLYDINLGFTARAEGARWDRCPPQAGCRQSSGTAPAATGSVTSPVKQAAGTALACPKNASPRGGDGAPRSGGIGQGVLGTWPQQRLSSPSLELAGFTPKQCGCPRSGHSLRAHYCGHAEVLLGLISSCTEQGTSLKQPRQDKGRQRHRDAARSPSRSPKLHRPRAPGCPPCHQPRVEQRS